ncbi:glycosyltransferase [Anaerolinea thermolimosa]|uniref:glycosyltransferase family 4 protein n=1 Tax=Anaerolinea thermolimosa TaxID=229919 RepID=UPI000780DE59|nr:glycosyltransferase [Anaerolinea thermolimosa]GAP07541.1 glycosyltransferase [Anaerolinea thermolimosa]
MLIRNLLRTLFVILQKIKNKLFQKIKQLIFLLDLRLRKQIPFPHQFLIFPSERKRVLLISHKFFGFDGKEIYLGGAERYLIELSKIIREIGYEPVIVQAGDHDWMHFYQGIWVVGLDTHVNLLDPTLFIKVLEYLQPKSSLIIYSPFSLYTPRLSTPSVGISHGIYWDSYQNLIGLSWRFRKLISSIKGVKILVSVDTTTINWIRTLSYPLGNKVRYVPNFVDLQSFSPNEANTQDDTITILYPRRLYPPRGFWLVADCLPNILQKYPQVRFEFVGQAEFEEKVKVNEWLHTYPEQVKWYSLPPDKMPLAYQSAHIVLIPTLHSEGTSLSCLEAMACGKSVIATNVGGLPDLIISGFNGILIEPSSSELQKAIECLVENPDLRRELGKNARLVAEYSFSLSRWQDHWRSILLSMIPRLDLPSQHTGIVVFPYSGIPWDKMTQRPHHLAAQLTSHGYIVLWSDPGVRMLEPIPNLFVLPHNGPYHWTLSNPILWIYYPFNLDEIKKYENSLVVYDVLDDIDIYEEIGHEVAQQAREKQKRLLERADIVLTSSQVLWRRIRRFRSDALYIPNGIDLQHFNPQNPLLSQVTLPYSHPIIGYHGAVATWFDAQLLVEVAQIRPTYSFVVIGPISDDSAQQLLDAVPNIHLVKSLPYEILPAYLLHFDVGIIPFKINNVTHAVRPLKALEYLSMKIPVVATPLEELQGWHGVLTAANAQEFAQKIDEALTNRLVLTESGEVKRLLIESNWSYVVQPLIDVLKKKSKS